MRIILLNYSYLRDELRELGVEVVAAGLREDCDLIFSPEDYTLENIIEAAGYTPDWIIFMDSLARVIPQGFEKSSYPMAAYFIDSTINRFWQRPLAQLFNLALTDQAEDAEALAESGLNAQWFPLAADTKIYQPHSLPKKYDITFIGNRNPETRIKRENILRSLEANFNLRIFSGNPPVSPSEAAAVYSQSRLTLNENLFPSVNLRLFEAMACGAAVLTEENGAGIDRLFAEGDHLVTYNPDNLLEKAAYYLDNPNERESIAEKGSELVIKEHSFRARAAQLLWLLDKADTETTLPEWKRHAALGEALMYYDIKWRGRDRSAIARARGHLEKSLELNIDAGTLLNLGKMCELDRDYSAAQKYFKWATDTSTADFRCPLYQGISQNSMGRIEGNDSNFLEAERRVEGLTGNESPLLPGSEKFHLFWGDALSKAGEAMLPGLMQFHLPSQFWTALEHFRRAAELNPRNWEKVGDLLMSMKSPDQALSAYQAAGYSVSEDKIAAAETASYARMGKMDDKPKETLLSLCMIVHNEANNLDELLSVIDDIPDQVVVVDTGSSDDTVDVALRHGADVFTVEWEGDFSAARNVSLEAADGRYIIYLDTDERINPDELRRFKRNLVQHNYTIFTVRLWDSAFGEECRQSRIFPNHPNLRFQGAVWEKISTDDKRFNIEEAPLSITHIGYEENASLKMKIERNLRIIKEEIRNTPFDYRLNLGAAICHMRLKQEIEAIEHLKRIVFIPTVRVEYPQLYEHSMVKLAEIFKLFSDDDTAIKLLRILLKEQPGSALGRYHLGMIYFNEQLYSECRAQLELFFKSELALGEIPFPRRKITGMAHYLLGRCLEHQGHLVRAVKEYSAALNLLDDQAKINRHIGRALYKLRDYTGARHYLQEYLKSHPESRSAKKLLKLATVEEKEKTGNREID